MKKDTTWGSVADWYDELLEEGGGTYQKEVILPNLLRLVNPSVRDDILDIACGQGFFSRAFSEKGAKVEGVDISPELIEFARKNSNSHVAYEVSKSDNMKSVTNNSFNKAVIVLAIQNIENIQGTFAEAFRVLRPGGSLYLVLNHPAFRVPGSSDWSWDEKNNKQFRRIDSYISEKTLKIDMNPSEKNEDKKNYTISFHRPLQIYFKALGKAGFAVTRLEEWISHKKSQKGPRAAEEDRMRKEIPLFLYIEAKKI